MTDLAEVRRLRTINEALQEENRQLREELRPVLRTPSEWRLTPGEEWAFIALTGRDVVPYEGLQSPERWDRERESLPRAYASSVIFKVRKKTKPFGVVIESVWYHGYALKDRKHWISVLASREATPANGGRAA